MNRIQVSLNGKVIISSSILSQGLAGIVGAIPDSAFVVPRVCVLKKCPSPSEVIAGDRKLLSDSVVAIQRQIDGHVSPKLIKVSLDLLVAEIRVLTKNNFVANDSTQLSQQEIFANIDSIQEQFSNSKKCIDKKTRFRNHRYDFLQRLFCH